MRVAVVGAGISGLAAATSLSDAGVETVVFEAAHRPGGRLHSARVNGCTVELGANFLTSAYRIVPDLAESVGLSPRTIAAPAALVGADGVLRAQHAARPWTAVASGLLGARDLVGLAPGLARLARDARGRGTTDPLDWLDHDAEPALAWARRLGVGVLAERGWAPAYHGFYFSALPDASAAGVGAFAAHGVRQSTWTFPGGLSTVTDALAARLDVRLGCAVTRVTERPDGVWLATTAGEWEGDAAIVALPGPALTGILALRPEERTVARTPYSSGLLVALGVPRRLDDTELAGAYGVCAVPGALGFAALCVASRAEHAAPDRDVVTCLFPGADARRLAPRGDAELIAEALDRLRAIEPGLADAIPAAGEHRVVRIPHAMPENRPGRLAHIAAYRAAAVGRRVVLASDALAWPWSDSAAQAGQWAAERVRATLGEAGAAPE